MVRMLKRFLGFVFLMAALSVLADTNIQSNLPWLMGNQLDDEFVMEPLCNEGDGMYAVETRADQEVLVAKEYLYYQMPDTLLVTDNSVFVEIVYYDEKADSTIEVLYDWERGPDGKAEHHVRATGTGSMEFVTAYFRLDETSCRRRLKHNADFKIRTKGLPIQRVTIRESAFDDPDVQAFPPPPSREPWIGPYTGPTRDDVDAQSIKGKLVAGYQGWFRTPNGPYGYNFVHWPTVDMWPDTSEYNPDVLIEHPGSTTLSGKPGLLFCSGTRSVVLKHFEWMRKYNIDGVYLQRFFRNANAGLYPEWVLAHVREAAHLHGRVWAIEYDLSGGSPFSVYRKITEDWKWLVDEVGITKDSRYLHEQGKPVVVFFGAALPDRDTTPETQNELLDFFKNDPVYGGNYIVGCSRECPSGWEETFSKYDSYYCWMENPSVMMNVVNKCDIEGRQLHAWPGFSWHTLKELSFPADGYKDRRKGRFLWEKITKGMSAVDPDLIFIGMFDEYDEGTAIMPMTDDHPQMPGGHNYRHFVTNEGMPKDWYMALSGYANDMLNEHVSFSTGIPSVRSLENRSNVGEEMTIFLGPKNEEFHLKEAEGLRLSTTEPNEIQGVSCRTLIQDRIGFDVDNSILFREKKGADVTITVKYFDAVDRVNISLEYDAKSKQRKHRKSFTSKGDGCWKQVRFEIDDAFFGDRFEEAADFVIEAPEANISEVRVILPKASTIETTE